jgi:hypothetical protein
MLSGSECYIIVCYGWNTFRVLACDCDLSKPRLSQRIIQNTQAWLYVCTYVWNITELLLKRENVECVIHFLKFNRYFWVACNFLLSVRVVVSGQIWDCPLCIFTCADVKKYIWWMGNYLPTSSLELVLVKINYKIL